MKKLLSFACAAVMACLFVQPSFAADSPWNGTWKMNLEKSKLTGDTFTISATPDGMLHYSNGSNYSYDFACDGKPHATLADRTISCTGSPEAGYEYTTMAGENVLSTSHRTFSPDGKTMVVKGTSMQGDGSKTEYEETYRRQSGTTGLVGKWMDVKVKTTSEAMKVTVTGGTIHVEYPTSKVELSGNLDGTFAPVSGPNIPEGAMSSYKAESPMKLHYVNKYKETVLAEGTEVLSADGKTITEASWEPGKMSEKATIIWEKQ